MSGGLNLFLYIVLLITAMDVFAYIGGLFGLIFPIFMMCLGPYNEYKFQLYVGESAFENTSASK